MLFLYVYNFHSTYNVIIISISYVFSYVNISNYSNGNINIDDATKLNRYNISINTELFFRAQFRYNRRNVGRILCELSIILSGFAMLDLHFIIFNVCRVSLGY